MTDTPAMLGTLKELLQSNASYQDAPRIGAGVLDFIDAHYARFVAYPSLDARRIHTLWTGHTHFLDVWNATPRLMFISPESGSGKTRALTVTSRLVPFACPMAELTPAYVHHKIEETLKSKGMRPTILYDEIDTIFGSGASQSRGASDIRRLVNVGFDRIETVGRSANYRRTGHPVEFSPYAAMLLAGKFESVFDVPSTIRTRSLIIPMQRRGPYDEVEYYDPRDHGPEADELGDLLAHWVEFVHAAAHAHRPAIPRGIEDRDRDCWAPLFSVADLAGGHWPETARRIAVTAVTAAQALAAAPSRGVLLLWAIREVFDRCRPGEVDGTLFSDELLSELKQADSAWAALSPMSLGKTLSGYGIQTNTTVRQKGRADGRETAKGYRRSFFLDAWSRYPVAEVTEGTEESGDE
jgi:hypothetical protein